MKSDIAFCFGLTFAIIDSYCTVHSLHTHSNLFDVIMTKISPPSVSKMQEVFDAMLLCK